MIWILIVLSIIILLFVLFLMIRMHIRLGYTFMLDGDHQFNMSMEIFGIKVKSERINFLIPDKNHEGDMSLLNLFLKKQKDQELKAILTKVVVRDLSWETAIGTGDAISTGIATGVFWSIKELSLVLLQKLLDLRCIPLVKVHSNYKGVTIQTRIECYFVLPLYMTFKLLKKIRI